MALYSKTNPRFITTIEEGWLVAIRTPAMSRVVTKTLRPQTPEMLEKAVRWRNRLWRRLFGGKVPERVFHANTGKNTATGIPGVRYQLKKMKRKDGTRYTLPMIVAEVYTIPGKDYVRPRGAVSRVFSLTKYDWDEAIALGTAWRERVIAQLRHLPRESE